MARLTFLSTANSLRSTGEGSAGRGVGIGAGSAIHFAVQSEACSRPIPHMAGSLEASWPSLVQTRTFQKACCPLASLAPAYSI